MSMENKRPPVAEVTFPDGSVVRLTTGPGVKLSGEALCEFARVCYKPEPASVELVEPADDLDNQPT